MSRPINRVRRQALLDTVVHYLGEHGVGVSSLRGIARDLHLHPNNLVHHFSTRTDLLRAALQRAVELQRTPVEAAAHRHPGLTQGDLIRAWWKWTISDSARLALARIGVEAASLPPSVLNLRPDMPRFAWQEGFFERLLETGLPRIDALTESSRITAVVTGLVVDVANGSSKKRCTDVLDVALRDLDGRVASATGMVPMAATHAARVDRAKKPGTMLNAVS